MPDVGMYIFAAIVLGGMVVCGVIFAIRVTRSDRRRLKDLKVMKTQEWYRVKGHDSRE